MEVSLTAEEQFELCATTEAQILRECDTEGYECSVSSYPEMAKLYCKDNQRFQCQYHNVSSPCAAGYYCPSSEKKLPCDRGHFCPLASSQQLPCPFSVLSCPNDKMTYPNGELVFLVYVVIFTIGLLLQKYFVQKMLSRNERSLNHQTDEESLTLNHGIFNIQTHCSDIYILFSEQESEQYKKTLLALSEQLCERPTMKTAAVRTIRQIRSKSKPSFSAERAKKNWIKLIKSRAFKQHVQLLKERSRNLVNQMTGSFVFQPVENPLTITFDHLNLDLASNGKPILRDIFGVFRPFNVTALMGSSGAGKVCN